MKVGLTRQIGGKDPVLSSILLSGALLPGILILFLFYYKFFYQIDAVKLFFISIGITVPVLALNYLSCAFMKTKAEANAPEAGFVRSDLHLASCVTAVVFYAAILIGCMFYRNRIVLNSSIAVLELLWVGVCLYDRKDEIKQTISSSAKKQIDDLVGVGRK